MDFWSNYISQSFQFFIRTKNFIWVVLVVFVPIVFVNKISPPMPPFRVPRINKTKSMFIQYFNFAISVIIPTTISLCNNMPQFKNTVHPVGTLAHMGQLLLKLSIPDMYSHCIFVESLRYKVLIFLCKLFGRNSLFILTTLPYNSNSAIQGGWQLSLKLSITDFYTYCIFVESLCYKFLIVFFLLIIWRK